MTKNSDTSPWMRFPDNPKAIRTNKLELIAHIEERIKFHKSMGPMGFVVVSELNDLLKLVKELR